jgi:hypothetical protein
MDGSKCYGCKGKGSKLTLRGKAGSQWFVDQTTIKASVVKIGQTVYDSWRRVTVCIIESNAEGNGLTKISFLGEDNKNRYIFNAEDLVRVKLSKSDHISLLEKALVYQNTLTKKGLPRKKSKAA